MANAKCRTCDHVAAAGAYCGTCAADIMAKALNPFFGGRRKKLPPAEAAKALRSLHSTPTLPVVPCEQLYADSFEQTPGRQAGLGFALRSRKRPETAPCALLL